jgi:UDP-N-acetylmuramate dehydrogenase
MSAGYLIDQTGLKKTKSGDAEISNKHANFIVNKKQATSNNIVSLIRLARNEVAKKFNIKLELEIKLLGFNDSTVKGLLNG